MSESSTPTPNTAGRSGRAIVLFVYLVVVAIAGLTGFLLGVIGPTDLQPVDLFFLIELPPTPLGLAIYGAGTLGGGLGVALLLVRYVSRRYAA